MLIVDTGPLLAAADAADPDHEQCVRLLSSASRPLVVSPLVMAEAAYLVGRQLGSGAEAEFLRSAAEGEIRLEVLTGDDLERIADLVVQYADLRLGATDASVVAIAERYGQNVIATLDRRHFSVVKPAHTDSFELLPL